MDQVSKQLSERERTVLLLAADGLTDKEIARKLSLSQRTIGTYWERMREKLGHYSRTQLVAQFLTSTAKVDAADNYKNIFSLWEEGVWIVHEDGTTLYANHRIAELFELTQEDFEKANARDLFETTSSLSLDSLVEKAKIEDQKVEFRIKKKDGTIVWLSVTATALETGKHAPVSIVLRLTDITVKRKVKGALDACELSIDFVTKHSTDYIARFDADLRIKSINESFERLIGSKLDGLKVSEAAQIFSPNDRWLLCLAEAIASGETQSFTCRLPNTDVELTTHLLPAPTEDGKTLEVISLTKRPCL